MTRVDVITRTEAEPEVQPVDIKLEVVALDVSDVECTKAFYDRLGWRLDIDVATGDLRGVQMTLQNSDASISFGKGVAPTLVCMPADHAEDGNTVGPSRINGKVVDPLIRRPLTYFVNFTRHAAALQPPARSRIRPGVAPGLR